MGYMLQKCSENAPSLGGIRSRCRTPPWLSPSLGVEPLRAIFSGLLSHDLVRSLEALSVARSRPWPDFPTWMGVKPPARAGAPTKALRRRRHGGRESGRAAASWGVDHAPDFSFDERWSESLMLRRLVRKALLTDKPPADRHIAAGPASAGARHSRPPGSARPLSQSPECRCSHPESCSTLPVRGVARRRPPPVAAPCAWPHDPGPERRLEPHHRHDTAPAPSSPPVRAPGRTPASSRQGR
ncbi:hypothetical protein BX283_0582 [Streptomyces sp. TLI_146]|nr:hypothetical protein BX283_0582 [Streptomyces sp. TLI_146]